MKFSLGNFLQVLPAVPAAAHAAGAVTGAVLDTKGFEEALIVINSGVNATNGDFTLKVQECATATGTFTDITGAAFPQITESNDNTIYAGRLNLGPRKRYLKVVGTVADAACPFSVTAILGAARELPVAQVNTLAFNL